MSNFTYRTPFIARDWGCSKLNRLVTVHTLSTLKIPSKSIHKLLIYPVHRNTDTQ